MVRMRKSIKSNALCGAVRCDAVCGAARYSAARRGAVQRDAVEHRVEFGRGGNATKAAFIF